MSQVAIQERLDREVAFFERLYADEASRGIAPLSEFDRRRYTNPPVHTVFPREYYYHLLGPLQGLDTLEMACGNGIDASICAHNGANVHAYDIASQSVEFTRRRAQINGLSQRMSLQVTGVFSQAFAGRKFDRIMGYAALHHIPMEGLAEEVYDRLKPGGVAVFAEPVINSQALHALRRCVPYYLFPPTEDEVPLNDGQIAEFARPFDRFVRREFQFTSRIWPFFPKSWALAWGLHHLDYWLLKLPMLRRFATVVVFGLYRDR